MLIICEDCAKKYNIDVSRIKGQRARFVCKQCGHIIIIDKSDISRPLLSARHDNPDGPENRLELSESESDDTNPSTTQSTPEVEEFSAPTKTSEQPNKTIKKGMAISIRSCFFIAWFFCTVALGILFAFFYLRYGHIPDIPLTRHKEILISMCVIAGTYVLFLATIFFILGRIIAKPLQNLTTTVNRISPTESNLIFKSEGLKEMRFLTHSVENMIQLVKSHQ